MKTKYKILYSLSEFMHGSMVKKVCHFVRGIDKDIFEPEICAEAISDEAKDDIISLNIPYFISPLYPPRQLYDFRRLGRFISSPLFLKKKKYDIVHSLHYSSLSLEPLLFRIANTGKYIYAKSNLQWDNHRLNWFLKSKMSDRIIAQSQIGVDLLESKGFSHKTTLIYNGVDCDEIVPATIEWKRNSRRLLGIDEDAFIFGYAAHFVPLKDHMTLIKAFKELKNSDHSCLLALCGGSHDKEYYQSILKYLEEEQLSKDVVLLGTISDMKRFYSSIDCLVFTSLFENFSNVVLEALSSGLPVIASRYGGNIEQVEHEVNGFLVEREDHEGFSVAMRKYLSNKELAEKHGRASRELAEQKYSIEIMVNKTEELYLNLLSNR